MHSEMSYSGLAWAGSVPWRKLFILEREREREREREGERERERDRGRERGWEREGDRERERDTRRRGVRDILYGLQQPRLLFVSIFTTCPPFSLSITK